MLVICALWIVVCVAAGAAHGGQLGLVAGLLVGFGGVTLVEVAMRRGAKRSDLLGRWCRHSLASSVPFWRRGR